MKTDNKTNLLNLFKLAFNSTNINLAGILKTVLIILLCIISAVFAIKFVHKNNNNKQLTNKKTAVNKAENLRKKNRQDKKAKAEARKLVMIDPQLLFKVRQESNQNLVSQIKEQLGNKAVAINAYKHRKKAGRIWISQSASNKLAYHKSALNYSNEAERARARAKQEDQQIYSEAAYKAEQKDNENLLDSQRFKKESGWNSFKRDFIGAIKDILRIFI